MINIAPLAHLVSLVLLLALSGTGVDASKDALVTRSDFWFDWLIGSTLAVALGVVCEIPECIYEWKTWKKHRNGIQVEENPKRLSIPVSVLGAIVVAIGVAVEGLAEYNGSRAETAIRKFDEDQTLRAQKDAGDAALSAKNANDSLASANRQLGEVDSKAKELEATLRKTSKQAKITEEMVQRSGPRETLLDQNFKLIIETLKPFAGQRFVVLMCGQRSPEMKAFWGRLMGLLYLDSKWVLIEGDRPICTEDESGIVVTASPKNEAALKARDALVVLLNNININAVRDMGAIDDRTGLPTIIESDSAQRILKIDPTALIIRVGFNPMASSTPKRLNWKKESNRPK